MLQKIKAYIQQNNMLSGCKKVVVALSGGADSVCLLLLMKEFQGEFGYELCAVHVNHCIRGQEADDDEAFCMELCRRNNIGFTAVKKDVTALAGQWHMSVEEAGRKVRYDAFNDILGDSDGRIAVAHHMNDNAETVLFNMARGSAMSGLVGIRPVNGNVIRPLLGVSRSEIEAFLKEREQDFCTDSTNAVNDYARNIVRNQIIPELCRVNEAAVENICALSEHMTRVENFLNKATDKAMTQAVVYEKGTAVIDIEKLSQCDQLIRENIAYRVICHVAGKKKDIERIHVRYLLGLTSGGSGKRIDLPYGISAHKEYNRVYVTTRPGDEEYDWNLEVFTDSDRLEEFIRDFKNKYPEKKVCTIEINCDIIEIGLVLRNRQPGDYITIDTEGRHKTVKKFFVDEKIPQSRRGMPIVFDGNEAVWIVGKRLNSRYAVGQDTGVRATLVVTGTGLDA